MTVPEEIKGCGPPQKRPKDIEDEMLPVIITDGWGLYHYVHLLVCVRWLLR